MKPDVDINRELWNRIGDDFSSACILPAWGPGNVGHNLELIGNVRGKRFLEIACGDGRSIEYLIQNGAAHVTGLDIAESQVSMARSRNRQSIAAGKVDLHTASMEEATPVEPVDVAFSIYGLGWTLDPGKTLSFIHDSLISGGKFIWSWDHKIFTQTVERFGWHVVRRSYHDETPVRLGNWRGSGMDINIIHRKTSTWFELLSRAGFRVTGYHEPEVPDMNSEMNSPASAKRTTHMRNTWHRLISKLGMPKFARLAGSSQTSMSHYQYFLNQKAHQLPMTMIFVCEKP